jgi:hypothetical protein
MKRIALAMLALSLFGTRAVAEKGDLSLDISAGPSFAIVDLGNGFAGAGAEGGASIEWEAFDLPLALSARFALAGQPLDTGASIMAFRASARLSYSLRILRGLSLSPFAGAGLYVGLLTPSSGIAGASTFIEAGLKASLSIEKLMLGMTCSYDFQMGLFHSLRLLFSVGVAFL